MEFYSVSDAYIAFLTGYDARVPNNYAGRRPYIGVILNLNGHEYLAPLTSYKLKQDNLASSNPTVFKIHEKGNDANKLGMVQLNNMIPIIHNEISLIDISLQEAKYASLLTLQLAFIKSNQEDIKKKAQNLYSLVTVKKNAFFCNLSCDFSTLEANYANFGQ